MGPFSLASKELENVTSRPSVSRGKAFLTSTEDEYRPPFGRTPITAKRSGVIDKHPRTFLHEPLDAARPRALAARAP
jgi:virulence-associated protein E